MSATYRRKILREPLVHFVLVGALLFGLDVAVHGADFGSRRARASSRAVPTKIVVDAPVKDALAAEWSQAHDAPPTDAELKTLIDRYVDDEVLYRAGIARGLDRDDPQVRGRVIAKMTTVLEGQVIVPAPTDDELRAFYLEHADKWAQAELYDFSQVFVAGSDDAARARADELLARLRQGADSAKMGDTFQGGRRYRRRKLEDLAATFGDDFVADFQEQEEGTWALHPSRFGLHLVRIDKKVPADAPSFEAARLDVTKAWETAKRKDGIAEKMRGLRAEFSVAGAP